MPKVSQLENYGSDPSGRKPKAKLQDSGSWKEALGPWVPRPQDREEVPRGQREKLKPWAHSIKTNLGPLCNFINTFLVINCHLPSLGRETISADAINTPNLPLPTSPKDQCLVDLSLPGILCKDRICPWMSSSPWNTEGFLHTFLSLPLAWETGLCNLRSLEIKWQEILRAYSS